MLNAIFLGIVQGLTEFIPVSSSGHLLVLSKIFNINIADESFHKFVIFAHLGTTFALLFYFRKKIWNYISVLFKTIKLRSVNKLKQEDKDTLSIILRIIIASIPAAIAGFLLENQIDNFYSKLGNENASLYLTILALFLLGIFYLVLPRIIRALNRKKIEIQELGIIKSLFIGAFQSFAIFYGISRSGMSISASRIVGLRKKDAAEFAFLMSLPVVTGATIYKVVKFVTEIDFTQEFLVQATIGIITSTIVGYLAIHYLLRYLRNNSLQIFGWYCIIFSVLSFIIINA